MRTIAAAFAITVFFVAIWVLIDLLSRRRLGERQRGCRGARNDPACPACQPNGVCQIEDVARNGEDEDNKA